MFAIATQKSFEAGYGGFIYFEAKNLDLVKHYHEKFGAILIGRPHEYSMIIDERAAKQLLEVIYTLIGGSTMTKKVLIQSQELERAAEKAGRILSLHLVL